MVLIIFFVRSFLPWFAAWGIIPLLFIKSCSPKWLLFVAFKYSCFPFFFISLALFLANPLSFASSSAVFLSFVRKKILTEWHHTNDVEQSGFFDFDARRRTLPRSGEGQKVERVDCKKKKRKQTHQIYLCQTLHEHYLQWCRITMWSAVHSLRWEKGCMQHIVCF